MKTTATEPSVAWETAGEMLRETMAPRWQAEGGVQRVANISFCCEKNSEKPTALSRSKLLIDWDRPSGPDSPASDSAFIEWVIGGVMEYLKKTKLPNPVGSEMTIAIRRLGETEPQNERTVVIAPDS